MKYEVSFHISGEYPLIVEANSEQEAENLAWQLINTVDTSELRGEDIYVNAVYARSDLEY